MSSFRTSYAMKLSAVYRCVTCISDSVAQLPIEILRIDSEGYKTRDRQCVEYAVLNSRPNIRMTRFTFMSLMVQSVLLNGNGYAYIRRNGGKVKSLIYIPSSYVTIIPPLSLEDPVKYQVLGIGEVNHSDIIHLVNQSIDGVSGVSVLEYARHTLGLSWDAEHHAAKFFASGCGIGGILKSVKNLNEQQIKDIKKGWKEAFGSNNDEPNGVAVLGSDLSYQPVTLNAKDAQLLETRQFNVIDICRFFGVSPVKCFDLTKSSYSTVEATNIGFLTDTIGPLLEKIEQEFEVKLFGGDGKTDVRFDVSQLLRADKAALASYYSTLFQIGAIAPNEIRREIDLPRTEGGEEKFVQVNMQPLKKAVSDQAEAGETLNVKIKE